MRPRERPIDLDGLLTAGVELCETRISWVLLKGDRAYKIKTPVRLPFVDYGSLERRHHFCREEVRRNRRLLAAFHRDAAIRRVPSGPCRRSRRCSRRTSRRCGRSPRISGIASGSTTLNGSRAPC